MCCQTIVEPVDLGITIALLEVGQFERISKTSDLYWKRELGRDEHERTMAVKATIELNPDGTALLKLYVEPSITEYAHHQSRRVQASTALEIAARVAERVGAEIKQLANVTGCADNGLKQHTLASYPEVPLQYANLCAGFRDVYGLAV